MKSCKETVKIRVCKGGAWERVDEAVSERLEIDANSRFMVTYNSDNDIIEECSVNGRQSSTTGSNQQSNFIHVIPSVNVYQTEYHATQMPVFPGSSGLIYQNLPSYQQMHGFFENPVYVPRFLGLASKDESSESDDESSESDEEGSESNEDEKTTPVENKNCKMDKFWSMPPLLKTPVFDIKKKSTCYGTSSRICLHDTFDSKEQIKIVLGRKALDEGFQIRYLRSDPQRVYAKCIVDTCGWIFRAYIPKDYKKFYVTTFVDHHTCTKTQIHPHHHNASPKVLGHILKEVMSESSRIYRGKEIMTDMKARGTPEESFVELPLYCHNLKVKNPGTITHIETDDQDRFEIFFLAVGAAIRIFVSRIRPLIIIDGAHLKGEFLDTMYLAVAMDGNKQILPRAYGVGKSETLRSCDWFLRKLEECIIGKQDNLTVISDGDQWYFDHRQTAEAKLAQRIEKSSTWTVRPAANYLYNVVDYYKNATVNLNTRTCRCGQWKLSGLPCGHLIAIMRHLRQSTENQFALLCFKTSVWKASFKEIIYDLGHPSEWEQPDDLITVLPPLMDKRPPGRPRNRDRFRSKGEQIKQKSCTRCFRGGHNRRDCPSMVPS
nr:hypothetical protein [Tanacetum cinerariifolium]